MRALTSDCVIVCGKWEVREMFLTPEKAAAIWRMLQRYKTLFSDLTRADPQNFLNVIASPWTMWFEITEAGTIVGIIYFSDMEQVVDATGHMVFFDRRPAEKLEVVRKVMEWMFECFPLHRITVTPPAIYHATVRLLERLGMTREGCRREAVLIGGKWNDQFIYGITREEALG